MVAPAFGFSIMIQLIDKVSQALKATGGSATEDQVLLWELQQLQIILDQLMHLPPSSTQNGNYLNAVRCMALTIQVPLREFLQRSPQMHI